MKFRALRADEIEVRVGMASEKGCTLLLYKDARCDMNILDETVQAESWQRRHYECKGNMYCSVGIKCGDEWIWKDDCGKESFTEKEKGEASDSFKRACVNWGIGRELYTTPRIWIRPEECGGMTATNGKYRPNGSFSVSHIEISEGIIKKLTLKITVKGQDGQGKISYRTTEKVII
jgi:hypothetical protein